MKRSSVLLLVLAPSLCLAQVWCPSEANWWYEMNTVAGGTGYIHAAYVADTVIEGQSAQKLTLRAVGYDQVNQIGIDHYYPPLYTALFNDVVSCWTTNGYDTLFNYGAVPGDHWNISGDLPQVVACTVTDTGTTTISGLPLRWWAVEFSDNPHLTSDTIIERVGNLKVFLDPSMVLGVTDPEVWGLRCYADQDISYNTGLASNCDLVLGLPRPGTEEDMMIRVDEMAWRITLEVSSRTVITIADSKGTLVYQTLMAPGRTSISTAAWAPGLYLISAERSQGRGIVRFIKR